MQMIAEFKRRLMDVPQPLVDGLEKVYVPSGFLELVTNEQLPWKRQSTDGLGLCSTSECSLEPNQEHKQSTNAGSATSGHATVAKSTAGAKSNGLPIQSSRYHHSADPAYCPGQQQCTLIRPAASWFICCSTTTTTAPSQRGTRIGSDESKPTMAATATTRSSAITNPTVGK